MKKLALIMIGFLAFQFSWAQYCGFSGPSLCTPSGNLTTPGFGPAFENLPPLINGDISTTVIEFTNFDSITFGGQTLHVNSFRIDSIGNLPSGLCWATSSSNNTFANQQQGCIVLNGTTCATPGLYRLKIIITVYVGNTPPGLPIQTDAAAANLYYYLRVNNAGDAVVAVDTAGQWAGTNMFTAYGNASDCSGVLSVDLGANQTICNGSNITLNPVRHGGLPPYTFTWSGTGDNLSCTTCKNPTITLTQSSTYTVTVVDATNTSATATISYSPSATNNQVQFTATNTDIDCTHVVDTSTFTVTGGTGPYTFNWGDGSSVTGASPQTHAYSQPNTYVVAVTDANNCVTSLANTINFNGISITATQTVQPVCAGMPTGKIKISASGGNGPYTYHWNTGATADSLTNALAGNYMVTVTDANLCSFAKYFSLAPQNSWGYYVYTQPSGSNCSNNGQITATVNGGTAPFTFMWSNGSTVQNLTGLSGGVYTLTVTDALGCPAIGTATVPTTCYSNILGTVFNDSNGNCQLDSGENQVNGVYVMATAANGSVYYGNAYNNGQYVIQIPAAGLFTLSAVNSYGGACGNLTLCNNVNHTVSIATIGDSSLNNDFGFQGSSGFDLNIHPGWTSSNPGFTKDYWVYFGNQSQTNFSGQATVTFSYDPNLVYQQSSPPAINDLANHTLTWIVDTMGSYYSFWNHQVRCTFYVPQSLPLGFLLQSDFSISPTAGDCDSSNNVMHSSETVTGSMDPNEKKVEPAGRILEEDSILTYTIGFQNTGTDSTHFIVIKDTLSANLDASSVRNIASSHPYSEFTVSGKGILTWTFNPLRLVDSFTNEKGSHGFVKFTIKKKKDMPIGSIISNTAHIYFDYNPAVITNTVADTISEATGIFNLRSTNGITVKAYPNPFSESTNIVVEGLTQKFDFELFDVTGRLRNRIALVENNQLQLQRDNLTAGIYFFKITSADKKKTGYGKLVVE